MAVKFLARATILEDLFGAGGSIPSPLTWLLAGGSFLSTRASPWDCSQYGFPQGKGSNRKKKQQSRRKSHCLLQLNLRRSIASILLFSTGHISQPQNNVGTHSKMTQSKIIKDQLVACYHTILTILQSQDFLSFPYIF